jgi:hypothetical protein
MTTKYTDDQVQHGLAEYELTGRNLKATARNIGVPVPTLRGWIMRAGLNPEQNTADNNGHDYGGMWGKVQVLAVGKAEKMVPDMPHTPDGLRAITVLAGVASDKQLDHEQGRKGAQGAPAGMVVPVQIIINAAGAAHI